MPGSVTLPVVPQREPAIYVGSIQRGDHYHYDDSNSTAAERRPITAAECWADLAAIPATPPAASAYPGTASGVVTGISGVVLAQSTDDPQRFVAGTTGALELFVNMVPANYADGAYQPVLTDAAGVVVPFSPATWVADGVLNLVEFKVPVSVSGSTLSLVGVNTPNAPVAFSYTLPLSISYWQYTGRVAAATLAPAAALGLYVGAAGSDVSGNGTQAFPYATLPRAFDDIRAFGYTNTATVNIVGSTFALPAGISALDPGTTGEQRNPVTIQGAARTVVASGTVAALARDATTGFCDITVAAPLGFALGQVVHFTAGNVAGTSCFIANVNSATQVRIPIGFASTAPAVGSVFNLEAIATTITLAGGATQLNGAGATVVFSNLVLAVNTPNATLTHFKLSAIWLGVWFRATAPSAIVAYRECTLQTGTSVTELGAYFDATTVNSSLVIQSFNRTGPEIASHNSSVFRGTGNSNLVAFGTIQTLANCYIFMTVGIYIDSLETVVIFVELNQVSPAVDETASLLTCGALTLATAPNSVSNISIVSPTGNGLSVINNGECFVFGPVTISGAGGDAVYVGEGGMLVLAVVPTVTAPAGAAYHVNDRGTLVASALTLVASGSTGADGVTVENGGALFAGGLTCLGNLNNGVSVFTGGLVAVSGATAGNIVTATGNTGCGIAVQEATMLVVGGGVDVSNSGGAAGAVVAVGGALRVFGSGTVTANSCAAAGIAVQTGSTVLLPNVTADANQASGINVRFSTLVVSGALSLVGNCTTTAAAGLLLTDATFVAFAVGITVTTSGTNSHGLQAINSIALISLLNANSLTCSANAAAGMSLVNSTVLINSSAGGFGSILVLSNGTNGVEVTGGTFSCAVPVTVTGHTTAGSGAGIKNTQGTVVISGAVAASGNIVGASSIGGSLSFGNNFDGTNNNAISPYFGLNLSAGAQCSVLGALTAGSTAGTTTAMIYVEASSLVVGTSLAPGSITLAGGTQTALGVLVALGGQVSVFGNVSASGGPGGVQLTGASRLALSGQCSLTAGTTTGAGLLMSQNSTALFAQTLTCTGYGTNINLATYASLVVIGAATVGGGGATTNEIVLQNATANFAGLLTISRTGSTIANAINIATLSRVVIGQLSIASGGGRYTKAIAVSSGSTLVFAGVSASTIDLTGATGVTDIISVDNSFAQLKNMTITGIATNNSGVAFVNNASGEIINVTATNNANGFRFAGARAELQTLSGTNAAGGFGVLLTGGAWVTYLVGTLSATSATAGNDASVGSQAAATWTHVDSGALQYVNDWSFPGGAAATINSVVQMCALIPHT